MSDLISRLLAGPDDVVLSSRELGFLDARLRQPISFATVQRERKQQDGRSPTWEAHNKLKLIRDFNRNLQQGGGESASTNKPTNSEDAGTDSKPPGDVTGLPVLVTLDQAAGPAAPSRGIAEQQTDGANAASPDASVLADELRRQTNSSLGEPVAESEIPDHVTLNQMAAMVQKSKKTLEKYKDRLPAPIVKVAARSGRADLWLWSDARPKLAELFGTPLKKLPEVHPNTAALRQRKTTEKHRKAPP
jgi:hypothetical protein